MLKASKGPQVETHMTPWFPEHITPIRSGVYPTRLWLPEQPQRMLQSFSYWAHDAAAGTGNWSAQCYSPEQAWEWRDFGGLLLKQWRGLTRQAAAHQRGRTRAAGAAAAGLDAVGVVQKHGRIFGARVTDRPSPHVGGWGVTLCALGNRRKRSG